MLRPPHSYRKISLDALLWALGGFAEAGPPPREQRNRRLAAMWRDGVSASEIGEALGMTETNVLTWRHLLGLPPRLVRTAKPYRDPSLPPPPKPPEPATTWRCPSCTASNLSLSSYPYCARCGEPKPRPKA